MRLIAQAARPVALLVAAALAGCGGGGGGDGGSDGDPDYPAVSYHESGGLRWSSTTALEVVNPGGLSATLEMTALKYCAMQTCDAGGANCRWTNFNGEPGWRLPTASELEALYARTHNPPGWSIGRTWSSTIVIDFATGQKIIAGAGAKAKVSCVKPA